MSFLTGAISMVTTNVEQVKAAEAQVANLKLQLQATSLMKAALEEQVQSLAEGSSFKDKRIDLLETQINSVDEQTKTRKGLILFLTLKQVSLISQVAKLETTIGALKAKGVEVTQLERRAHAKVNAAREALQKAQEKTRLFLLSGAAIGALIGSNTGDSFFQSMVKGAKGAALGLAFTKALTAVQIPVSELEQEVTAAEKALGAQQKTTDAAFQDHTP